MAHGCTGRSAEDTRAVDAQAVEPRMANSVDGPAPAKKESPVMIPTSVYATGNVINVINGVAPGKSDWISLNGFKAGFEAGSPSEREGIGEFVSFNGVGYAKSTKPGDTYYTMVHGPRVITNGAVFIRNDASASFRFRVDAPMTLEALYERVHAQAERPVCIVGTGVWDRYHGTAISKAPVEGENIFDERDSYYSWPPVDRKQVAAGLMGCIANLSDLNDKSLRKGLGAVLYDNPFDPPKGLVAHSHTLELNRTLSSAAEIRPEHAVDVHHIFQDSVIASGAFDVYAIGEFVNLPLDQPGSSHAN